MRGARDFRVLEGNENVMIVRSQRDSAVTSKERVSCLSVRAPGAFRQTRQNVGKRSQARKELESRLTQKPCTWEP
jgi:hypothetical protein